VDKLIVFFANTFPYLVILAAGIFLVFHHEVLPSKSPFKAFAQKWKEIMLVFFSGIAAWVLAELLKFFIHTERPFLKLSGVVSLFDKTGYAFPSGHATFFMALAFALFFSHRKVGYVFIIFAVLIGLARIAAGVHFPVDILGGFVLGILTAYLVKFLYKKVNNKKTL
jgi:undecaprenyl-diphosphatase